MTLPNSNNVSQTEFTSPDSPLTLSLDQIEGQDISIIGGKSFRLAKLKRHGFNVPNGLVLTTHFFKTQLQHARLIPLWAGSPDVAVTEEALIWLADSLKTKPLSKELNTTLNSQLYQLFGPDTDSYAVRSSVIDEDQRDQTFAGVHLTELGVPRSAIAISISRCWASALTGPAIQYRQDNGMSIQGIQVAVLIQPTLSPDSAGVGFTINPITGAADELVIEAIWGLGNALVSGDVQPYFYRLSNQSPTYPLIEQRNGDTSPPTNSDQTEPLSAAQQTELAGQLEQIEALMGEPQDVEWAYQNNTLHFLQTRPVAAIPEAPQMLDQIWTRANFQETLPDLPSPFFGSLLEHSQPNINNFFETTRLKTEGVGPYAKLILGRPYLNLTLLKRAAAKIGLNMEGFLQSIGYTTGGSDNTFSVDWQTAWQARKVYRIILNQLRNAENQVAEAGKQADGIVDALENADSSSPPEAQLAQLRQQEKLYTTLVVAKLQLDFGIALLTSIGSQIVGNSYSGPAAAITAMAFQGVKSNKDNLHQELRNLAQLAQANNALKTWLLDTPDFGNYPHNPVIIPEFKQTFDTLLATYGRRATFEADPGWPRYDEEPDTLLRLVAQYAKIGPKTATTEMAALQQDMLQSLSGWRRMLLQRIVNKLRHMLTLRLQLNDHRATGMAAIRNWNLKLGQQWVAEGWLEQTDDIFWLTLDEIERTFMVGTEVTVTLSSAVQARKETHQIYEKTNMPPSLKESQLSAIQLGLEITTESTSDVTVGLPVSPGQTRGTVTVVNRPDDVGQLPADTILVMPSTGPDWLPLLHLAAGLIVETGGLLSHGSVIAREYGLPAVANIPQATHRFQSGDKVLVDGSTGVVQLLEAAQPPV